MNITLVQKNNRIKLARNDRIFIGICTAILILFGLMVLYPLIYILSSSLSSARAITTGSVWLFPVDFTLKGYVEVFNYRPVWTGFANSLFYTIFGVIINVSLTILAAYPLSRRDFFGRKTILMAFTFTMLFTGGIIPTYLLIDKLDIVNTRWAMLLPKALVVQNIIIARSFFMSNINQSLSDAAEIDGCSDMRFLSSIVLPLSGAIIAVLVLFYAVDHWNTFFDALIYLRDEKLFPLQLVLRDILVMNQIDASMMDIDHEAMQEVAGMAELLKFSLIIVSSLPMLILYPFIQKFFVKGVMMGSLKG
jgi:multiple sugar transport system permease protein/putative aldouronate transport system permease protein